MARTSKNNYLPYSEAKALAQTLGYVSSTEWMKAGKSNQLPKGLPTYPYKMYNNEGWSGWKDFLPNKYVSYTEAQEMVKTLGIKTEREWFAATKENDWPDKLPKSLRSAYPDEWDSWSVFCGRERCKQNKFLPYDEAKAVLSELNLQKTQDWYDLARDGNVPDGIPSGLDTHYKDKGWKGYTDILSLPGVANKGYNFVLFNKARSFARKLRLKSKAEWKTFLNSDKRPDDIPTRPDRTYSDEWVSWGDFLGTKRTRRGVKRGHVFAPLEEAKKYAKENGITSSTEWNNHIREAVLPEDIPTCPSYVYKEKGWVSWPHFLR